MARGEGDVLEREERLSRREERMSREAEEAYRRERRVDSGGNLKVDGEYEVVESCGTVGDMLGSVPISFERNLDLFVHRFIIGGKFSVDRDRS